MILKPQDVVVLLKLAVLGDEPWTFQLLAAELFISPSEIHSGVRRAAAARLVVAAESGPLRPVRSALLSSSYTGSGTPTLRSAVRSREECLPDLLQLR